MTQNTTRAPKGKALFKASFPDGYDEHRASGTMDYTHALIVGSLDQPEESAGWGVWSWHKSKGAAVKASNQGYLQGRYRRLVVPVEIVDDRRGE